jgi:hypothetical protein
MTNDYRGAVKKKTLCGKPGLLVKTHCAIVGQLEDFVSSIIPSEVSNMGDGVCQC